MYASYVTQDLSNIKTLTKYWKSYDAAIQLRKQNITHTVTVCA